MSSKHGWFSPSQFRVVGDAATYLDANGKEVKVTEVTSENKPYGKWTDYQYVGVVTKCIKGANTGSILEGIAALKKAMKNAMDTSVLGRKHQPWKIPLPYGRRTKNYGPN
jgi:hypothetical protein